MKNNIYEVDEISIGQQGGDRIVFKNKEDMEEAYRDVDNGNDIYVMKDGLITKLLHQMISAKIYEGKIQISAKVGGKK